MSSLVSDCGRHCSGREVCVQTDLKVRCHSNGCIGISNGAGSRHAAGHAFDASVQPEDAVKAESRAFSLKAHAKLNLRLEIGPRAGLLHRIVTVMAQLDLADELHFAPSSGGFEVRCEGIDVAERENLIWKAAHAFATELPSVRIVVDKRIPVQAGLGGGSADAAGALIGLAHILADGGSPIPRERLADAALRAGSDVPSLLVSGLRIVSGVGDVVEQRPGPAPGWGIVLLRPAAGSSTVQAYKLADDAGIPHDLAAEAMRSADEMCAAFVSSDFERFTALLRNDFDAVVEREIAAVASARERLSRASAPATMLCGSGSCVAGFFETRAAANEAFSHLSLADGEWATSTGFRCD